MRAIWVSSHQWILIDKYIHQTGYSLHSQWCLLETAIYIYLCSGVELCDARVTVSTDYQLCYDWHKVKRTIEISVLCWEVLGGSCLCIMHIEKQKLCITKKSDKTTLRFTYYEKQKLCSFRVLISYFHWSWKLKTLNPVSHIPLLLLWNFRFPLNFMWRLQVAKFLMKPTSA